MTDTAPEVFEAEAMQHIDDLYRTAVRLTMSQTEAEDLVQETYMPTWPCAVNLKAFDSRFLRICCRRFGSLVKDRGKR